MKKRLKYYFLKAAFIIVSISLSGSLDAQIIPNIWADAGKTNMSDGLFIKGAVTGEYRLMSNTFGIGGQMDIISYNDKPSPALTINYSRQFRVDSMKIDIKPFLLYHRFSGLMYEIDYGLIFKSFYKKFIFSLGTNFRTYSLTSEAKDHFNIEEPGKIKERFNIMYSLTWHVMPLANHWNIGFTACNYDHFTINQETNPLFNIRFTHRLSQSSSLYFDFWYQSAGALNLSVNTYGYFFRTGMKWQIEH